MHAFFLIFFMPLSGFTQVNTRIEVIPNPQSLEDFDHQFKGCPENSECDPVMGLQLKNWNEVLKKLGEPKEEKITDLKKAQVLELFRQKYGLPVKFYTYQKSQLGFKPVLYSSACKNHNSKNPALKVLEGISFIKALTKDKAMVWRDQALIEVPTKDLVMSQPVQVYYESTPTTYYLPISDQPLFIKNKELIVIREDEGMFYALNVAASGEWKVVAQDFKNLSQWENKRENVPCPLPKAKVLPAPFEVEFCKTIWNEDTKKTVIVKMYEGCTI